ncbi:MAG: nucleotidyltransferase domain-containing protein, partial [bacterium]
MIDKVMALNGFKHDLLVFGSSANGLALKGNSDLDLSV